MIGEGVSPPLFLYGDIMFESVLLHAVNIIVGILLATLWQKHKRQKEEQDAIKAGLQSLLRGEITKAYYRYTERGWIPVYALESLQVEHSNYEKLGVNNVIDGLWSELLKLPHTNPNDKKSIEKEVKQND